MDWRHEMGFIQLNLSDEWKIGLTSSSSENIRIEDVSHRPEVASIYPQNSSFESSIWFTSTIFDSIMEEGNTIQSIDQIKSIDVRTRVFSWNDTYQLVHFIQWKSLSWLINVYQKEIRRIYSATRFSIAYRDLLRHWECRIMRLELILMFNIVQISRIKKSLNDRVDRLFSRYLCHFSFQPSDILC